MSTWLWYHLLAIRVVSIIRWLDISVRIVHFVYLLRQSKILSFLLKLGSENCFQLKIETKVYAWENTWSLGTCGSNREYISNVDYTETCCLDAGQYRLRCNDNGQDGWHGGFIEIQGTRYCQDFTNGKEQVQTINITAAQGRLLSFL